MNTVSIAVTKFQSHFGAQGKDVSCLKQPAAGLVKLALDRWHLRGMRADNISAVVILLDRGDGLDPSAAPVTTKCRDDRRPKDVLSRVRLGRQPRRRLRTVLGKICRLRAQRSLPGGIRVARSPLGTCNRLSAARPATSDEGSMKRPLRRRSYQEACGDADTAATDQRHLRVSLPRVSVELLHSYADPDNDKSDVIGSSSRDPQRSEADVSHDDGTASEESVMRLSGKDSSEGEDEGEESVLGTSTVAEAEDNCWCVPRWQSTIDLCSPTAVDQRLPAAVQCVSA